MNSAYASYEYIRKLPYAIVNKLTLDCPEIWKLMKYADPMGKPSVPISEIGKMICPNSMNMDIYNVVFQKFSKQALSVENKDTNVFAQMRLQIGDMMSVNRTTGRANIIMEFIVNEKQMVCDTDLTPFDNRAVAMVQSVISCLNGNELGGGDNNYIYIDGLRDRSGGFKLVKFNDEYSGYILIMNVNILG